jgi:hypothetical protein
MEIKDHPIYDVYDFQRTVCLNIKYYGRRLRRIERLNFWIEVVIAITAPGSALAGLWFADTEVGKSVWMLLTAIATTLAVVKPFLKFPSNVKRYEQVLSGYRALMSDVEELVHQIKIDKEYTKASRKTFEAARRKKSALAQNDPEPAPSQKIIEICMDEVNKQIPPESLYIPEK